ncbi:F0F1 ATP synthase subunit epsilon [Azospirillum cavernae]|uniref:ATP synthase epsilon chain n=1 Tax=Azospirillum cavernae TaxID=2320860 RepID=A0A418VPP9_9PROT|nr:F0F1 ATP synthase subunit epsilon [Azospirillum cavernae]RJF78226.1 F0F1 ATP synthase subunit epsilon [Azospirillum cavernae]
MTARLLDLVITTPTAVVARSAAVTHLRAEDDSGAFGILPGHADLLTALSVSVVSWREADDNAKADENGTGRERHCAVRGGVLTVSDGARIAVATREAVAGDDLAALERDVLTRFRQERAVEGEARGGARRLRLAAVRHILSYLRPDRRTAPPSLRDGGEGDAP